jgi:16S rRNA (adenine1518-N6/adenine1519-N6)-dimethyltransferase
MVRPKKHLGQHFLKDKNIARNIVALLSMDSGIACELGPGKGVLTGFLLQQPHLRQLVLVEVDRESIDYLNEHFDDERLRIIASDFLKLDLPSAIPRPFSLIGNFPYNISSQIFFKVLENREHIPEVVCMIQKEVAERITSPPGNKSYGILSVLLNTWYDIAYGFTVGERVFFPPPKVKSAVIRLTRNDRRQLNCDEVRYHQVVKAAFGQRRKTLRNALRSMLPPGMLQLELLDKRAEQLVLADFEALTRMIDET